MEDHLDSKDTIFSLLDGIHEGNSVEEMRFINVWLQEVFA